jgi:hypothetical protein
MDFDTFEILCGILLVVVGFCGIYWVLSTCCGCITLHCIAVVTAFGACTNIGSIMLVRKL